MNRLQTFSGEKVAGRKRNSGYTLGCCKLTDLSKLKFINKSQTSTKPLDCARIPLQSQNPGKGFCDSFPPGEALKTADPRRGDRR